MWGGAARFAAERYRVKVVGATLSRSQSRHAKEVCKGLPVAVLLRDFRNIEGQFDRIFSLGMLEHVGHRNYRPFMDSVRRLLVPDGLFLLQTTGANVTRSPIVGVCRPVFRLDNLAFSVASRETRVFAFQSTSAMNRR